MVVFDVRALENEKQSGVHVVTAQLARALAAQLPAGELLAVANTRHGAARVRAALGPGVTLRVRRIPNKLLHASMRFLGFPQLETLAGVGDATVIANPHHLRLRPGSRLVLLVHDLSYFRDPSFFPWRERIWHRLIRFPQLLARANTIVTFSDHTARDLETLFHIPRHNIVRVTPGLDPLFSSLPSAIAVSAVRAKFGLPKRYALMLGGGQRKNVEMALRALTELKDVAVVVTGATPAQVRTAKVLGIDDRFLVVPHLSAPERAALLAGAEMLWYPSHYEGFGLPPLEAMAFGVPVIASLTSSLPEVVGECGVLIPPYDAAALVAAVRAMAVDPAGTAKRVALGRSRSRLHTWDEAAGQMVAALTIQPAEQRPQTAAKPAPFVVH